MKLDKERIKFIVMSDLMLKGPLWALLLLAIWGAIAFGLFWVVLNVIKPSIDQRRENRKPITYLEINFNTITLNKGVLGEK